MTSPESAVRSTIEQFFHALDTQDLELMKQVLPRDETMVHIGTDKDEIWIGWSDLLKATREQFRNLRHYKAIIRDLTIKVSRSGDVAWYFHSLDASIQSKEEENHWEGARFTGVLEKRDGHWVLVQTHVSLPDN